MGVKKTYRMVINPLLATVVYCKPLIWKNIIPANAKAQTKILPIRDKFKFVFLIQNIVGRQTTSAIANLAKVTDIAPRDSSPYLLPMKPAPQRSAVNVASKYPIIVRERNSVDFRCLRGL